MPLSQPLSGKEVVRVFEALGWEVAHWKGSHIVMTKEGLIVGSRS
jgi:predicted RNA binding protein YcfA (HicA-like mRNA interferase family)